MPQCNCRLHQAVRDGRYEQEFRLILREALRADGWSESELDDIVPELTLTKERGDGSQ